MANFPAIYVSDGIYPKLENSTIYPLCICCKNGAMVSMYNIGLVNS